MERKGKGREGKGIGGNAKEKIVYMKGRDLGFLSFLHCNILRSIHSHSIPRSKDIRIDISIP